MEEMMSVFRATELSKEVRIKIIKKLGRALNMQYAMNWTDEIVDELVKALEK